MHDFGRFDSLDKANKKAEKISRKSRVQVVDVIEGDTPSQLGTCRRIWVNGTGMNAP